MSSSNTENTIIIPYEYIEKPRTDGGNRSEGGCSRSIPRNPPLKQVSGTIEKGFLFDKDHIFHPKQKNIKKEKLLENSKHYQNPIFDDDSSSEESSNRTSGNGKPTVNEQDHNIPFQHLRLYSTRFYIWCKRKSCVIRKRVVNMTHSIINILTKLDLRKEHDRLSTFQNYTGKLPSSELATHGFYLYKTADFYSPDTVKCAFCYLTLDHIEFGMTILQTHTILSPNCPLLCTTRHKNIPLRASVAAASITQDHIEQTTCKICYENLSRCLFLPCRHVLACESCSYKISSRCPVCRSRISQKIDLYFV